MYSGTWWRSRFLWRQRPGRDWAGDKGSNTVLRGVYKLMHDKCKTRAANCVADSECERRAYDCGPEGLFPQSYRAMRSALNVRSASEHERHMCDGCGELFPRLPRDMWRQYADQQCDHCGCDRFRHQNSAAIRPWKRAWIRPLRDTLESFINDSAILDNLGSQRVGPNANQAWSRPYFQWLDGKCGGVLKSPGPNELAPMFALGAVPWIFCR